MAIPLTNTRYEISIRAIRTKSDSVTYQDSAEIFKLALSDLDMTAFITHLTNYQYKKAKQITSGVDK
jgi:hypothetical protein